MPLLLCPTILLAAASIAVMTGRWNHVRIRSICGLCLLVVLLCAMASLYFDPLLATSPLIGHADRMAFKNDGLALCEQGIVLVFGLFAGIAVCGLVRSDQDVPGACGFLLFVLAGLSLVAGANDFLALGLSFEVLNLSVLALERYAGSGSTSTRTAAPGFGTLTKVNVGFDWFASIWMWLGIALLANAFATTQFDAVGQLLMQSYSPGPDQTPIGAPSKFVQLAAGFIAMSLFIRLGMVPVHLGFYSGWRDRGHGWNGVLAQIRQLAGSIALTRLFGCLFAGLGSSYCILATTLILVTFAASTVMAVRGFSAGIGSLRGWIASLMLMQSGWLVVGSMIAALELESNGVRWGAFKHQSETLAAIVFLQLAGVLAFSGVFSILTRLKREEREIEFLEDVKGLGQLAPVPSLALLVGLASVVGTPFTAGFWAKWTMLLAGYNVHTKFHSAIFIPYEGQRLVIFAGLLAAMLGASAVIRIAREMLLEPSLARPIAVGGKEALVAGTLAAAASLMLGLFPDLGFIPLQIIQYPRTISPVEEERGSGKNSIGSMQEFGKPTIDTAAIKPTTRRIDQ